MSHHVCSMPFKTAPSIHTIPDYYGIVDREDVVLWPSVLKRQFASRDAFFAVVAQMHQNAIAYNRGCEKPNKRWEPGSSEPQHIRVGPGRAAAPAVASLMDVFVERVHEYFARPEVMDKVWRLCFCQTIHRICISFSPRQVCTWLGRLSGILLTASMPVCCAGAS
jgi:hypothetical protein